MDVKSIQQKLRVFARDRDWEQYHTPKNLSMALAGEAAELLEIFQWMTSEESLVANKTPDGKRAVEEEIADIHTKVVESINGAVQFARESPYPEPEDLLSDMYANPISIS